MASLLIDGSMRLEVGERRAIRRVLRLANDYLLANCKDDTLVTARGGLMTWGEIRNHLQQAEALLNPRNANSLRKEAEHG